MQDFTDSIKKITREAILPMLKNTQPIKSGALKQHIITSLGYTRDQFGYTQSGGSKIENLISSEIFSLKQKGMIAQENNLLTIVENQNVQAPLIVETQPIIVETQPMVEMPVIEETAIETEVLVETQPIIEEPSIVVETQPTIETQPMVVETQPIIEEPSMVVKTQPIIEIEPTLVIETRSLIVEETREEKLLACDSFRNSLIEATACYGNYNKSDCTACLLSKWCVSYTEQVKAQRKEERQARQQAKTSIPE